MDEEQRQRSFQAEETSELARKVIQPVLEEFNDTINISKVRINYVKYTTMPPTSAK
jgi:hypothetical protein